MYNHLTKCKQISSGLFKMLSTIYTFNSVYLRWYKYQFYWANSQMKYQHQSGFRWGRDTFLSLHNGANTKNFKNMFIYFKPTITAILHCTDLNYIYLK